MTDKDGISIVHGNSTLQFLHRLIRTVGIMTSAVSDGFSKEQVRVSLYAE